MKNPIHELGLFVALLLVGLAFGAVVVVLKLSDCQFLTREDFRHRRLGKASWYEARGMVCASRQYRVGTYLRVTYHHVGIIVKVTSRGPALRFFRRGRIIDLSREAFGRLEATHVGLIDVQVEEWQTPHP